MPCVADDILSLQRIRKAILDTFNVAGGKKTKPTERDRDLIKSWSMHTLL